MSSALNADFFGKEVILYTASGVVWAGGRQIKSYSWQKVLSFAEQLGLRIHRVGDSEVGEIRIYPESVAEAEAEAAPMESLSQVGKAHFIRGVNLIARFLDRETADLARYSQTLEEVIDWVERLRDFGEATQATLNIADAWLDEVRPSVPAAPAIVRFGCEHCGTYGDCECEFDIDFDVECQAHINKGDVGEYLTAEDDGPKAVVGLVPETVQIAESAAYVTVDPRSGTVKVDGEVWPGSGTLLIRKLGETKGWTFMGLGSSYQLQRWMHDERFAAQASEAAKAHPEPVVIEAPPTENARVVILTPYGMFESGKTLHVKSYPKGWHLGRAWTWLQKKGWHVVERDVYRGQLRHVTFAKA